MEKLIVKKDGFNQFMKDYMGIDLSHEQGVNRRHFPNLEGMTLKKELVPTDTVIERHLKDSTALTNERVFIKQLYKVNAYDDVVHKLELIGTYISNEDINNG